MQGQRTRSILAGIATAASVAGCSVAHDQYIVNDAISDRDTIGLTGATSPDPINLDTYIFPEDLIANLQVEDGDKPKPIKDLKNLSLLFVPTQGDIEPAYKKAVNSRTDRNRLQFDIIRRSNEICEVHQGKILANQAILNFSTGLTSTVLSGISAVLGGETAKTALSTASAAVGATGAEANANFYQNLLATAILKKINEIRATEYDRILTEQTKEPDAYPVSQAVLDVAIYHAKCSFFVGVTALASDDDERLSFSQIQNRIKALNEENNRLAPIAKDEKDDRYLSARMQLRFNETEIMRLKVLQRSASGAALEVEEESLAEQTVAITFTAKEGERIQGVNFRRNVVEKYGLAQGLKGCAKNQAGEPQRVTAILSGESAKVDAALEAIKADEIVQRSAEVATETVTQAYEGTGIAIIDAGDETLCGDPS